MTTIIVLIQDIDQTNDNNYFLMQDIDQTNDNNYCFQARYLTKQMTTIIVLMQDIDQTNDSNCFNARYQTKQTTTIIVLREKRFDFILFICDGERAVLTKIPCSLKGLIKEPFKGPNFFLIINMYTTYKDII